MPICLLSNHGLPVVKVNCLTSVDKDRYGKIDKDGRTTEGSTILNHSKPKMEIYVPFQLISK